MSSSILNTTHLMPHYIQNVVTRMKIVCSFFFLKKKKSCDKRRVSLFRPKGTEPRAQCEVGSCRAVQWSSLGVTSKPALPFLLHSTKHWFRVVNRSGFGDKFLVRIPKENWKWGFMNYEFPKVWIPNQDCETSGIRGWTLNKVILTFESAYTRKCR